MPSLSYDVFNGLEIGGLNKQRFAAAFLNSEQSTRAIWDAFAVLDKGRRYSFAGDKMLITVGEIREFLDTVGIFDHSVREKYIKYIFLVDHVYLAALPKRTTK